ncbi:MAG: hypothetical protein M3680_13520 [Myxococcota bacterium]|nr:hypothetical protein [Myxococcota bacterium]
MLLTPVRSSLLLLALATPFSIGCGDDPIECVGHDCSGAAINLPEGGEIRLELIGQKDSPAELRVGGWFATEQTPATRPMPRPPADWRKAGSGLCADMRSNEIWPTGDPMSRTYADAGATLVMAGATGTPLTLNKAEDVEDELNNYHKIAYLASIDPRAVTVNTEYEVQLAGGADIAAQSLETKLYLPENFETSFPDMDATVVIPHDQDFPFIWAAPPNVDAYSFAFAAFTDQIDPIVFCIGPNDGSMVVPKEMIDLLPPGGTVQLGVLNHRVEPMKINGGDRRIDLVAINCKQSSYSISTDGL